MQQKTVLASYTQFYLDIQCRRLPECRHSKKSPLSFSARSKLTRVTAASPFHAAVYTSGTRRRQSLDTKRLGVTGSVHCTASFLRQSVMNYMAYPEYYPSYSPSDADFSHVASSGLCCQQPQDSDSSSMNFMVAAAGNLDILLRKPKKSRRKVNLRKYIDRQLKRRLLKLGAGNRPPHELSCDSFRTDLSEDEKTVGWDWLLEDDDEDDDNDDTIMLNARTRAVAIGGARRLHVRTGPKMRVPAVWKPPSSRGQTRARRTHQAKNRAQKPLHELHDLDMKDAFEDNILDLLDTIGGNMSDNSDSGYSLSEGLPDSGSPPITKTATTIKAFSSHTSQTATAPRQMTYTRRNVLPKSHPADQMAMQMHQQVWHGCITPTFPHSAAVNQDLPVQLASIPTEQLLPTAVAPYY